MCKLLVAALIISLFSISCYGQIAAWDFFGQNSPVKFAATTYNANLILSLDSITRGSGANSSSGTNSFRTQGFKDDGISVINTDYFQITLSPNAGYNLSLSTIDAKFAGTSGFYLTPGVTSQFAYSLDGTNFTLIGSPIQTTALTLPQIDLTGISALQNIPFGTIVTLRYYASGQTTTGGWGFYSSNTGSNGLAIGGTLAVANPNNNDSYVQNPATQIAADSISSLIAISSNAVPVFKATVNDTGSGDGLPTKTTTITLKNYNPANGANWQNTIQGITVLNGSTPVTIQQTTITNNTITLTFLPADLIIPDGGTVDLTFSIYLNQTGLIDGSQLQFYVSSLSPSWGSDMSGSAFLTTFASDVISNIFTIDVTATKLQFVTEPQVVWVNQNFNVSVKATDINNNIDLSAANQVTIQKVLGSGILNSLNGLSVQLVNGTYNWLDLTYNTPEYFSLKVTDNNSVLSSVTSNIINCVLSGQILNESFTDGDFNNNPAWFGETGDFIIDPNYELELFTTSTTADTSVLVTPVSQQLDSIEWQAYINLNFSPSLNNYIKYYLISNNINLKDTLHGYFIKIGETGSNDTPELYYQSGNTVTLLCRGTDGIASANPKIRIKVVRTNTGLWRMYADPTGGSSFELQATAIDNSFFILGFFTGVFCNYSSTYTTNKFFFDDFYCGPIQVDTIPPDFVSLSVIDSLHLDLNFSEGISLSTAQNTANYIVNNGIGSPSSIIRDATDYKLIHLTFATSFVTGTTYTIIASNLKDFSDNTILNPVTEQFIWYKAVPFDVQINEIMANPTPVIGLPDAEYIELYNRSVYDIDLINWTLTIGTGTDVFPSVKIPANDYLILCTQANQAFLQSYGNTVGVISSSTALVDAGKSIILQNKEGQVISNIEYSDTWYRSSSKESGGWSLEQIDPMNPCGEYLNWTASTDIKGGTPGEKNSVYGSNTDNVNPELFSAILNLPDTLLLTFNETLSGNDTLNITDFSVDHTIGNPTSAIFTDLTKKKIKLIFNQTFVKDTIYEITVIGQLKDCANNLITTFNKAQFAIPDSIDTNSFIINEVLFNPYTGGTDYVELYNNTSKIYDLREAKLFLVGDTSTYTITNEGFYLFPDNYAVLSTDPNKIYPFYSYPNKKVFIKMDAMPSYNSADGRVTIINKSFQIIDDLSYTESMQFQLLNSFQGVSLERVHPDLPTQDTKNWHSAAESAGFGTPGYKNSQYAQFDNFDGEITIEPEVFSPDNDGYNDLLNIRYKFGEPGYVANVAIFDAHGRKIKSLISNEMLAIEGYFTWDGLNDNNQKALIGIYVIFVEVFNLNGKTKHFKKTCVLGSKL